MKIGFYYHTPVLRKGSALYTASYLGCFLNALAIHVDELILFMHEADENSLEMNYKFSATNIRFVSLGRKPRPEIRAFLGRMFVGHVRRELASCDTLLVRAPTPLLATWARLCSDLQVKMVPFLVGDYTAGNASDQFSSPKKQVVRALNHFIDWRERNCLRQKIVLTNSRVLAEKYQPIASKVYELRSTTLSTKSFFERENTCQGASINLLYTGRYTWQKGLQELMDAFKYLVLELGVNANLHFAGWEDGKGASIEGALLEQAAVNSLAERIFFHGKKSVGPELDYLYRIADIYVIPSYAEGFPRTIWEAMANSCPVVATRVGAIPYELSDAENALLVPPRNTNALVNAIARYINEPEMRKKVIAAGRVLAQSNTLESQAIKLATLLKGV